MEDLKTIPAEAATAWQQEYIESEKRLREICEENRMLKEVLRTHSRVMTVDGAMQQIHATNRAKGFWDKERNIGEMLMLVVSELSEALEADRKGKHTTLNLREEHIGDVDYPVHFEMSVKDTFEDELADAVIRIFDIAEGLKIALPEHIAAKMKYNATRPHMHGKKY